MRIINAIVGLIIGVAFTTGGVLISLETAIPTYHAWHSMKSWQPASAVLMSVKGASNSTEATYRYTILNQDYQNNRVYATEFKDNIGDYHQQLTKILQHKIDISQPISIWYNPENPRQSVIDRDMRWGLFALMAGFCSVFIFIGLGVCFACLKTDKSAVINPKKPSLISLAKDWKKYQADNKSTEGFIEYSQQRFEQYQEGDIEEKPLRSPPVSE
jgi:hypothetical protein